MGASAPPYEVSVVHCIEGKENLDNVTALFDLETPFMKGFFEAPVMKGQESTLKWNTFGETERRTIDRIDSRTTFPHSIANTIAASRLLTNRGDGGAPCERRLVEWR